MIYVKIKETEENKSFFKFGSTGYGWCKQEDLENSNIDILCEDDFCGARGYFVDRDSVEVCKVQKECPYE